MNIPREDKKLEAIKRMNALKIYAPILNTFIKKDIVCVSEPPLGALYYLDDEEKAMVSNFEKEHNVLVYLVVRSYMEFGKCDSLLYVSDHKHEWCYDWEDINENIVMTYTINHDAPDCSEFGSIGIKKINGGLIRV